MSSTLLKALLRERHWQKYGTFCKQYDQAAEKIDPALVGTWPSRAQYARWLAGQVCRPHPDHCRILVAIFPGVVVDQLFRHGNPAPLKLEPTEQAGAQGILVQVASSPASSRQDVPLTEARCAGPRTPLEGTLGEEIAMSTDESARFVRQARGTVDHDVLDQLRSDVANIAASYLTQPPYLTFTPLARLRREVFDLLDQRQRPAVLPDLYRIAGQLCALMAHASLDLGQAYAAETHTRTAWLCADLSEDNQLRTYTRWVQSMVAYWSGRYKVAAEIAQLGQQYATSGTSLLRLASQEARAHAAAEDRSAVEQSLALALAARETANVSEDAAGGVFCFEPGKAAYYASEVRVSLGGEGNFRRAISEAGQALDLFNAQAEQDRCAEFVAAAQIDGTLGHIALRDLDAAVDQLQPVLTLPAENRTLPIAQRMQRVGHSLTHPYFAGSTLAAELRERISFFGAYTAARELPAV